MRAIEITAFGGPEMLALAERPIPKPKAGEILLRVKAAGVNRPDVMQRKGLYPPPRGAPDIPGLEVAGEVVRAGRGVKGFRKGAKVCALLTGGGYAEYAVAPKETLLPVPRGLSFEQAAGIPETFFTVWSTLFGIARLEKGETVLVHGGASGVGTAAIQIAKAMGATVFVTAGTDEKCALCRKLGAKLAVNYKRQDFVEEVRAATKGRGVDVVLDMVGGDYIPRNIKCLAEDGRLVLISFLKGASAEVNFAPVLVKRLTITGATLRARSLAYKQTLRDALKRKVWPLLASKKIRPVIDRTFPLSQASEAHAYMESGAHAGKIILLP